MQIGPWPRIRRGLETGEIDLNPGVFRTPGRERHLDFTTAAVWVHHAVFVREDSRLESLPELRGGYVLVNRGGFHDDRIAVESQPGEGSAFHVLLPRAPAPATPEEAASQDQG